MSTICPRDVGNCHRNYCQRTNECAERAASMPAPMLEPGPWGTMRQPGGLWIADRLNPKSRGGSDRLPKEGAFRTETDALEAIAQATKGATP